MVEANRPTGAPPDVEPQRIKRSFIKMGVLVIVAALLIAAIHFTPAKAYLTDLEFFKKALRDTGLWAPLIFTALSGALIFIGAPRLALYALGGVFFGFFKGLLFSQLAALLGSLGPFLFSKWLARDWAMRKVSEQRRLAAYAKHLKNPTILDIFVCRQLPIWGLLINLLLGTTYLTVWRFIIGSFLGFLPQGMIFSLMGSGFGEESFLRAISKLWAAIPLVALAAIATIWLVRYAKKRRS